MHEEALETASKAALSMLQDGGHPAADATRQAILTTLRALPSDEPAGRLTRPLQPGGFEMLAGLSIGGGQKATVREKEAPAPAKPVAKATIAAKEKIATKELTPAEKRAHAEAMARAREAATKAERELRAAEHTAQREEFEAARAAREAEKADRQIDVAREAVETAQQELKAAQAAAATAARARDAAERRSEGAQRAVEAARARHAKAWTVFPSFSWTIVRPGDDGGERSEPPYRGAQRRGLTAGAKEAAAPTARSEVRRGLLLLSPRSTAVWTSSVHGE